MRLRRRLYSGFPLSLYLSSQQRLGSSVVVVVHFLLVLLKVLADEAMVLVIHGIAYCSW